MKLVPRFSILYPNSVHRFFLPQASKNLTSISEDGIVHQLSRVLRIEKGSEVIFFNGDGSEYVFHVDHLTKREIRGKVVRVEKNSREPEPKVTLYCAILKRENFELVCQKATEVGVSVIVPLLTERTVKTNINNERLKKIIQEAAEQSGRARIPALYRTMRFSEALQRVHNGGIHYFFDSRACLPGDPSHSFFAARYPSVKGRKKQMARVSDVVNIYIGSEGGWSETERTLAQKSKCTFVSLGSLTLRAETAAIVASYMMCQDRGAREED